MEGTTIVKKRIGRRGGGDRSGRRGSRNNAVKGEVEGVKGMLSNRSQKKTFTETRRVGIEGGVEKTSDRTFRGKLYERWGRI